MAFTYTDRNKKVVIRAWGTFKATVLAAVEVGDLLSRYASDATATYRAADQSDGYVAEAVALEDGIAGEEITCALAAELKAPTTLGDGGAAAQVYFAASTDYLGSPLYIGEAGKPQSSAGATTAQYVGLLTARDTILLIPNSNLTGQAGSFTTLATSSTVTLGGNTTVSSGKNLTLTKGTLTNTEGDVVLTKGNLTMTAGSATLTLGDIILTEGALTLTKGNATLTAGNLTLTLGNVVLTAGDIDLSAAATGTYDIILKDATADALSIRRATTDMMVFNSTTPSVTITPATTITGLITANGGITVASGKDVTLTKGTLTNTEGNLVMTKGDITMTAGNITMTAGGVRETITAVADTPATAVTDGVYVVDTSAKDIVLTLPSAVAGMHIIVVATSATKQVEIDAASGDKLLNTSYVATDKVKANAAAGANIHLVAISTTNWLTIGTSLGTWTYS